MSTRQVLRKHGPAFQVPDGWRLTGIEFCLDADPQHVVVFGTDILDQRHQVQAPLHRRILRTIADGIYAEHGLMLSWSQGQIQELIDQNWEPQDVLTILRASQ